MIFNNTRNFNKYLLWLFYCIFNYNLKIIIKYIKCIYLNVFIQYNNNNNNNNKELVNKINMILIQYII